jgi:hypothetical protein
MTKNTIRLRRELTQKDVCCQRARAVERLCRCRERQIIGLLGWEFTETVERARWRVNLAHGFQQQILQSG